MIYPVNKWRYPQSWIVYNGHYSQLWMMTGGTPISGNIFFYWLVLTGTWVSCFHILGISSSQLTHSYFSLGMKSPTNYWGNWWMDVGGCLLSYWEPPTFSNNHSYGRNDMNSESKGLLNLSLVLKSVSLIIQYHETNNQLLFFRWFIIPRLSDAFMLNIVDWGLIDHQQSPYKSC